MATGGQHWRVRRRNEAPRERLLKTPLPKVASLLPVASVKLRPLSGHAAGPTGYPLAKWAPGPDSVSEMSRNAQTALKRYGAKAPIAHETAKWNVSYHGNVLRGRNPIDEEPLDA